MSTLISIVSEESNLRGYLAIDSTINGRCYGGLRMVPYVSLSEIAELARVMTLKYAFVGLPFGGGKAWIAASPDISPQEKQKLLKAFGKALLPFLKTRSYAPGADLGTTWEDIRFMLASIGVAVPRSTAARGPGFYTSLTVLTAATRAARHIGLDMARSSLAIEGFGKVGSSVARVFSEKGVRVVAISTSQGAIYCEQGLDVGELLKLYSQVGSRVVKVFPGVEQIEKDKLLELEVDLLSPCAGSYCINQDNAGRVAAKIISPGANIPLTSEAEQILFQRGVLCIPDFVANCGGILGANMSYAGLGESFIMDFIDRRIGPRVTEVIEDAEEKGVTPGEYAKKIAEERFSKVKERAENSLANRAFDFASGLYRKGLIPQRLVGLLSARYFEARLK